MTQFYWAIQFMVIKCLLRNNKMKKKNQLGNPKIYSFGARLSSIYDRVVLSHRITF